MKGFYVYCIRPKLAKALPVKTHGVEFAKSITVFPFKDLEAIVGELDPSKFDAEMIKNKLLDDPKWAEENIRCHHEVVSRAFQTSVVVPMKFGTMYKNKKSLDEMLAKYYRKFTSVIPMLKDKKEWGVKAHLDHKKFIEGLKKKSKEIQKLEKGRTSAPEGMRWYAERKIDEIVADESEKEIEKELQYLVEKLEKHVEKVQLNEAFSKNTQELGREMIMNAACLVKNDALQGLRDLFRKLAKGEAQKGVVLELTGPWPPYNFVEIKNNDKK